MFRASSFTSSPFARLTCLVVCFALILSNVSFAVGGKSKKNTASNNQGASQAQRTQGAPTPICPIQKKCADSNPGRPKRRLRFPPRNVAAVTPPAKERGERHRSINRNLPIAILTG